MNKINNQHGDLILVNVDQIPKDAKKVKNLKRGYILERGEGVHTHILEDVEGVEVFETAKGDIYVRVSKPVRINHEEHGIQTLQPGIHKKQIERVFDYESMEARKVID